MHQAVSLQQKGSLEPHDRYPYWPLRTSRDEAIKRFGAFHPKNNKPSEGSFVTLERNRSVRGWSLQFVARGVNC